MTEQVSPLITLYKEGWENHQQALVAAIAQLSREQLALPIAAHGLSIGELLAHMIDARVAWFYGWMGEEGLALVRWQNERFSDGQTGYETADLVAMFKQSWQMIADALDRWTSADLEQVFPAPAGHQAWLQSQGLGPEPPHTRRWIVWHVLEHEIHHGGELSLALGTHGIDSFYTW